MPLSMTLPHSLSKSHIRLSHSVFREQRVKESSWSEASRVGTRPWPSDDVDLGFIIQLLHDSLLFDGQDGVANWTTTR